VPATYITTTNPLPTYRVTPSASAFSAPSTFPYLHGRHTIFPHALQAPTYACGIHARVGRFPHTRRLTPYTAATFPSRLFMRHVISPPLRMSPCLAVSTASLLGCLLTGSRTGSPLLRLRALCRERFNERAAVACHLPPFYRLPYARRSTTLRRACWRYSGRWFCCHVRLLLRSRHFLVVDACTYKYHVCCACALHTPQLAGITT